MLTDNEIKKALECCNDELHWCSTCPYFLQDKENDLCREDLCKDALDLIIRQEAEIERLKYNLEAVLNERADHSEAIKEFAEILKESISNVYIAELVDKLAKRTAGDST